MNSYQQICKSFFLILALALLPAVATAAEIVSVKKDNVNVRTGPGTNFPIYMELFQGYPLKVLDKKGDWLKISDFESDTGWIYAPLVVSGNTVIANGKKSINMRSNPSTSAAVVATVDRAVVLTKLSAKGKWIKVKHSQGTVGWVYAPLVWP